MTAIAARSSLHRLVQASRPLSWVNTAYPFAAAYLLTTHRIDAVFVIGTLFFLVPYNLAMYGINDVFDFESDVRNPRKGGLEGAVIDRGMHRSILLAAAATTVPFLLFLAIVGSAASLVVLAVSVFALLAYSVPGLRFKERPVLDSATSSTHFVSPAVFGLTLAGATFTPALTMLLVAFFLWGMASHAFGAVQDVVPDREGGIASIATALGARRTVRFAVAAWLLAGLAMLATSWPGPLAGLLVVPYVVAAAPFWNVTDARSGLANRGWRRFLWINYACGFVVTLLLIGFAIA